MKIGLLSNGNSDNPKLWSGTPYNVKSIMSHLPGLEVETVDFRLPRLWRSICYRALLKHHAFLAGDTLDPWYRGWTTNRLRHLIKKTPPCDFYLFIFGCFGGNIPEISGRYAFYTDNISEVYFRFFDESCWWREKYENYHERYARLFVENAALIFTQNEWTRQYFLSKHSLRPERVINVGFGVNLEPYYGVKDYSREELLIVLRRGTEHYKGLDLLLDGVELLKKKRPGVSLSVVGTTARSVPGVRYYEGFPRAKTVELFQQATLYTMPALREPNGITYLEALANRVPIVGLNRFAFPEFSGYGKWGFIAEHEDPRELADVLDNALSDKQRLKSMGDAGQRFVLERYDWSKVCHEMIDAIKQYQWNRK